MGIEIGLIAALVSAAVGVASTVKQTSATKKAAKADKRARQLQQNKERAQQIEEQRKAVRERRIKAARVEQSAVGTGSDGSSGSFGVISSLDTQTSANVSRAESVNNFNDAISTQNQVSADARSDARQIGAFNKLFQTDTKLFT